jgi:secreted trypsin-like serine protease
MCAGDLVNKTDICQGDSGGSLYVKETIDGKEKFVSAGIASYGYECGELGIG